jgi:hypothetical protein
MVAQPRGQAFGLTIGQKVDNRITLQINQDRPVAVSATPCPIIDGEDTRDRRHETRVPFSMRTGLPAPMSRSVHHADACVYPLKAKIGNPCVQ